MANLLLVGALAMASAAAQPASPSDRSWQTGRLGVAPMCFAAREAERPDGTLVVFLADSAGGTAVAFGNPHWQATEAIRERFKITAEDAEPLDLPATGIRSAGQNGYVGYLPPEALREVGSGRMLRLGHEDGRIPIELPLSGATAALASLRSCAEELAAEQPGLPATRWFDPFGLHAANPARAQLPASVITDGDYPAKALRAADEGPVTVKLEVGPDGRVSDCIVHASSGSETLDSATCRIYRQRAVFLPARDESGQPVEDVAYHRIVWRIGG